MALLDRKTTNECEKITQHERFWQSDKWLNDWAWDDWPHDWPKPQDIFNRVKTFLTIF